MNKADTRRLHRAQKIADEFLRTVREDVAVSDADAGVVGKLYEKSSLLSYRLPERCIETRDWALNIVKFSVDLYFASMAHHSYLEGEDGGQLDVIFSRYRDRALVNAKEIMGLLPSRVRVRERESWTQHWVGLCERPNLSDEERDNVAQAALDKYPDFDLSLLGIEVATPMSEQYARDQVRSVLASLGELPTFEQAVRIHKRLNDISMETSPWPKEIVDGSWEDDLLEASTLANILSAALSRYDTADLAAHTRRDLVGVLRKLAE